jgi:hypothetical protein
MGLRHAVYGAASVSPRLGAPGCRRAVDQHCPTAQKHEVLGVRGRLELKHYVN